MTSVASVCQYHFWVFFIFAFAPGIAECSSAPSQNLHGQQNTNHRLFSAKDETEENMRSEINPSQAQATNTPHCPRDGNDPSFPFCYQVTSQPADRCTMCESMCKQTGKDMLCPQNAQQDEYLANTYGPAWRCSQSHTCTEPWQSSNTSEVCTVVFPTLSTNNTKAQSLVDDQCVCQSSIQTMTPSPNPSPSPTHSQSPEPTSRPTPQPSSSPTAHPSPEPTPKPSPSPTANPSPEPVPHPTPQPSPSPTPSPSSDPTSSPSPIPSSYPTPYPTNHPTTVPTASPTLSPNPTMEPTTGPTSEPTHVPSAQPSPEPTFSPTSIPTHTPTSTPTPEPTMQPSEHPTHGPTPSPSAEPSPVPTPAPPTFDPTQSPTHGPSQSPTSEPTHQPTPSPSYDPTWHPTAQPSTPGPKSPQPSSCLRYEMGTNLTVLGYDTINSTERSNVFEDTFTSVISHMEHSKLVGINSVLGESILALSGGAATNTTTTSHLLLNWEVDLDTNKWDSIDLCGMLSAILGECQNVIISGHLDKAINGRCEGCEVSIVSCSVIIPDSCSGDDSKASGVIDNILQSVVILVTCVVVVFGFVAPACLRRKREVASRLVFQKQIPWAEMHSEIQAEVVSGREPGWMLSLPWIGPQSNDDHDTSPQHGQDEPGSTHRLPGNEPQSDDDSDSSTQHAPVEEQAKYISEVTPRGPGWILRSRIGPQSNDDHDTSPQHGQDELGSTHRLPGNEPQSDDDSDTSIRHAPVEEQSEDISDITPRRLEWPLSSDVVDDVDSSQEMATDTQGEVVLGAIAREPGWILPSDLVDDADSSQKMATDTQGEVVLGAIPRGLGWLLPLDLVDDVDYAEQLPTDIQAEVVSEESS